MTRERILLIGEDFGARCSLTNLKTRSPTLGKAGGRYMLDSSITDTIARHIADLGSVRVRTLDTLLLGSVDGDHKVQPLDLNVIIEVAAPVGAAASVQARIVELFNVLGARRVPGGMAYACAVGPTLRRGMNSQTFTILIPNGFGRQLNGLP